MLAEPFAPVAIEPSAVDSAAGRLALAERLKAQAYGLGFDLVGITALGPAETAPAFEAWVAAGRAGEMHYLTRGAEKRRDTRLPYAGATTAIVVAMNYGGKSPSGPVARYARGDDYHDVMSAKLSELQAWLGEQVGAPVHGKPYVDTGPILERDLARRAGMGWFGKNTNLLNPALGSFFFLGALVVDLDLPSDAPFETDRCGSCTRCLDACPTQALVEPRVLDATRCISYLTIELKGAIPEALRAPLGDLDLPSDAPFETDRCGSCTRCLDACPTQALVEPRVLDATRCISYLTIELKGAIPEALRAPLGDLVYGCDICQDVCPWNEKFAAALPDASPLAPRAALGEKDARTLSRELLAMTGEEFRTAFKGSPMKRAKLRGLKRNAAVVLGNVGDAADAELLSRVLDDPEPLVREHATWALARLGARLASFVIGASFVASCATAVPAAAPRPVTAASADTEVRALFAAIDARWNAHDAAGMAALHTADSDLLIRGLPRLRGRESVRTTFERMLAGAPSTLHHRTVVDETSLLSPGVTVAEGSIVVEEARADTTLVRGRLAFVAVAARVNGAWQVRWLRASEMNR